MVLLVSRSASSDKRGNFVPFCCFLSLPTVYKYKLRSSSMRDRSFYLTRRSPRCLCLCERANRDGYSERTRRNDHLKKLIRAKTKAAKKKKKKERKKEKEIESIEFVLSIDRSIVLIVDIRRISKVFFLFILISLFLSFFFFSSSSSSSSSSSFSSSLLSLLLLYSSTRGRFPQVVTAKERAKK